MSEVDLDSPRMWVEFPDPDNWDPETEHPHTVIRADLTWLTSSWSCIFGRGCAGIDHESPQVGCCVLGAHFSEKSDEKRVRGWVEQLTPELWQRHPGGEIKRRDWSVKNDEGERQTKVVPGHGCIFANDADFGGGSGCALHHLAAQEGVPHVQTKPDVCWQVPIRRTFQTIERGDGTEYLEVTIAEYDRRAWGEGGHDLDWYCTGNPDAHVGSVPVYESMRDELIAMIGEPAFEQLESLCVQVRPSRKLLPLSVHPATAVAERRAF